jgi:glucan endo-1,6-beta-glucosidase
MPENKILHVQMMGSKWGSGNPTEFLTNAKSVAFDDHRYVKWDSSVPLDQETYVSTSCRDNRNGDSGGPTIVAEWSISPPDKVEHTDAWRPDLHRDFYKRWFAAQVKAYETFTEGWVFWTWKAQLGDYRWSYKGKISIQHLSPLNVESWLTNFPLEAVTAGVIPTDLDSIASSGVCPST